MNEYKLKTLLDRLKYAHELSQQIKIVSDEVYYMLEQTGIVIDSHDRSEFLSTSIQMAEAVILESVENILQGSGDEDSCEMVIANVRIFNELKRREENG